jgi:ferredoxin
MKFFPDKCSYCENCRLACSFRFFKIFNPEKSRLDISSIEESEPYSLKYKINICTQCGICYEVCPFDAYYIKNGVYYLDEDKCTLCKKCVKACPEDAIFTHKDLDYVLKCIDCGYCALFCPTNAIVKE